MAIEMHMDRIEFRKISSITEYRELIEPRTSSIYKRFGIEHQEQEPVYSMWKPLTGSKMLTLTSTELRLLADIIEK